MLTQDKTLAPCPHFQHLISFLESSIPHDPGAEIVSSLGIAKQLLERNVLHIQLLL